MHGVGGKVGLKWVKVGLSGVKWGSSGVKVEFSVRREFCAKFRFFFLKSPIN